MKITKTGICFGLVAVSFILFSFGMLPTKYPVYLQKKINKEIKKSFKADNLVTTLVDDAVFNSDFHETDVFKVENESGEDLGYIMITLASACKVGGCTLNGETIPQSHTGQFEEFYFMTVYNNDRTIQKIRILEYDSTYGYEIAAKSWLKQFIGKVGGKLKYEDDIDGISGATVSVKSLIKEVNQQDAFIDNIMTSREGL